MALTVSFSKLPIDLSTAENTNHIHFSSSNNKPSTAHSKKQPPYSTHNPRKTRKTLQLHLERLRITARTQKRVGAPGFLPRGYCRPFRIKRIGLWRFRITIRGIQRNGPHVCRERARPPG